MTEQPVTSTGLRAALSVWFRPPRAHGQVIHDRTVSFLELFYDLVYVVLVAQIAHTLAGNVTWAGVRDFAAVFVLIWFAWLNGTLYHELHGGEDGRSRSFIFTQMGFLVVLAVYAAHAADDVADGARFRRRLRPAHPAAGGAVGRGWPGTTRPSIGLWPGATCSRCWPSPS